MKGLCVGGDTKCQSSIEWKYKFPWCVSVWRGRKVEREWEDNGWSVTGAASWNGWLHSRFVPWDHSCGTCRIDWEQLFCSPVSSYRRWHCLHSGDGQRGMQLSLNSVCSLRVGTQKVLRTSSSSVLGTESWGRGPRCQTEWDWWQDTTSSWSRSRRTRGAINYSDYVGYADVQISLENMLLIMFVGWN